MKTGWIKMLLGAAVVVLLSSCEAAPVTSPDAESPERVKIVRTYSKYDNGPVSGVFFEIETGSRTDVYIQESMKDGTPLASIIWNDEGSPMAQIEFNEDAVLEDISVRARNADSDKMTFDIELEAEKFGDFGYIVDLPAESGLYYIIADMVWPDGLESSVGFVSEVREDGDFSVPLA